MVCAVSHSRPSNSTMYGVARVLHGAKESCITQEKCHVNTDPFCTIFAQLDSIWYKYSAKMGPYLHGIFPVLVSDVVFS